MHWHHLVMYHPQVHPICHWATVKSWWNQWSWQLPSSNACNTNVCFLGSEWNYHSACGKNVCGFSTHLDGNLNCSFGKAKRCNIYRKTVQFWMFFLFFARVFVSLGCFSTNLSLSQYHSQGFSPRRRIFVLWKLLLVFNQTLREGETHSSIKHPNNMDPYR